MRGCSSRVSGDTKVVSTANHPTGSNHLQSRFTRCCACHEICTSRSTKVLRVQRNLHFKVRQVRRLPHNLQTSHVSKSHDSLRPSRNLRSSTITTMSKVLHLPRKLHFEVKQLQSLAPVRFPLRLPRKVTSMYQNAHGATTTTRVQSLEAPAAGPQIL